MATFLGTTKSGKTLEAYMQENRGLYKMRLVPGGSLPEMLSGEFTSVGECMLKAKVWLAKKEQEHKAALGRGTKQTKKAE